MTPVSLSDHDSDLERRIARRERVRIAEGTLEGLEGILVDRRPGLRVLISLDAGLYVELAEAAVERADD